MPEPAEITIRDETWDQISGEVDMLATEHFKEVDEGVEPRRKLALDKGLMAQIFNAGVLSITAARADGALIGYCLWTITSDVECAGLLIAQHGPWFVRDGFPGVGSKMLKQSIEHLKVRGVKNCYPHHRLQGRGAKLGALYKRLGAIEIQHTYSLWIGD